MDGAAHNAPKFEEAGQDGKPKRDIPPKPDQKTEPIEALRWALKWSPAVPEHLRKPDDEIESMCQRFEEDIAAGRRVWDDFVKQWVAPPEE